MNILATGTNCAFVMSHDTRNLGVGSTRFFSETENDKKAQFITMLCISFQPSRLRFLIDSPFWGRVFSQQGSGLSSTRLFGASLCSFDIFNF
jgi:hypothetical protein